MAKKTPEPRVRPGLLKLVEALVQAAQVDGYDSDQANGETAKKSAAKLKRAWLALLRQLAADEELVEKIAHERDVLRGDYPDDDPEEA